MYKIWEFLIHKIVFKKKIIIGSSLTFCTKATSCLQAKGYFHMACLDIINYLLRDILVYIHNSDSYDIVRHWYLLSFLYHYLEQFKEIFVAKVSLTLYWWYQFFLTIATWLVTWLDAWSKDFSIFPFFIFISISIFLKFFFSRVPIQSKYVFSFSVFIIKMFSKLGWLKICISYESKWLIFIPFFF